MSIDADDEILQDFLVEASEIVELLGEQLVDLEQRPDDSDLLNAIFRGFHTVKGGAGFLGVTPLVETCHRAEDVFNVLRQGQRSVTPHLMDAILQALDVVNGCMDSLREGEMPEPADPELLHRLDSLTQPDDGSAEAEPVAVAASEPEASSEPPPVEEEATPEASGGDEISEDEFEALLDDLHGKGKHGGAPTAAPQAPAAVSSGDDITDDEFEALLDQLHGKGQHAGVPSAGVQTPAAKSGEEITEDEFEALLDELHGKGQHKGAPAAAKAPVAPAPKKAEPPAAVSKPAAAAPAKAAAKPVAKAAAAKPAAPPAPAKAAEKSPDNARSGAKTPTVETTVRVDTQRLDDIMNMVGELVLVRNRLATLKATMADEELANAVGNLDVVTADLQLSVMKTRMQPVKKVFGRFPRVVRDLARNLKKEVDLVLHGEETDLDKNLVEALADPLVHLVRNAVDHGIESPEDREKAGKSRQGTVVLSAAQEGDHILLSIEDDGKGMDAEVLRRKAVEKGMMDEDAAARLEEKDCYNLIFHPGFSTKTEISDVSGRGVGMDVVKTRIAQMNGMVEIDSVKGKGSKITIKLPLTLAILPTLMVVLGQQPFALPLASVVEIFNLDLSRTNTVDGQLTIRVRDRALPLFYLRNWLVRDNAYASGQDRPQGHVVVVNVGGVQVGLVVDLLVGQEEVVIKPLGALLQGLQGMAGATITGDGKIALILDVPGLMRKYARRH
ncbi:MAG: chemotaxis protein CheA [Chromatiaceae bacterium]|nr:chemotaxis protein CheA [Gammaproteobacteria bacterium]MCP5318677.1 chemotaxis protein CheA [Chromatiaceae bacterium]MCP5435314.1 chemotaxis protein CheA [Chromatiaceae bacterium]